MVGTESISQPCMTGPARALPKANRVRFILICGSGYRGLRGMAADDGLVAAHGGAAVFYFVPFGD